MQHILSVTRTLLQTNVSKFKPCFFSTLQDLTKRTILQTYTPIINPVCGFKVKGRVRRRCKSCYFVYRDERKYVICPEHPRHKQMAMKPKPHNTWILTHASQSPTRPCISPNIQNPFSRQQNNMCNNINDSASTAIDPHKHDLARQINIQQESTTRPPSWQRVLNSRNPIIKKPSSPAPRNITTHNTFSALEVDLTEPIRSPEDKIKHSRPLILYAVEDIPKLEGLLETVPDKNIFYTNLLIGISLEETVLK